MTIEQAQLKSITEAIYSLIDDDYWSTEDRLKMVRNYLDTMKKVQGMNYEETKTYFNEKANQATA